MRDFPDMYFYMQYFTILLLLKDLVITRKIIAIYVSCVFEYIHFHDKYRIYNYYY